MNLLERYTNAVSLHLPSAMRDDIRNELYADLRDECDDLAETQGQPLSDEQMEAIVLKRGHPLLMASKYLPRKTLVSEALFPVYMLVLKYALFGLAIAFVVIALVDLLFKENAPVMRITLQAVWGWATAAFHVFGWTTLAFYVIGESLDHKHFFRDWHPRQLPRVINSSAQISRFESGVELVFQLLALGWLNSFFQWIIYKPWPVSVQLNPELLAFVPWINIVLVLGIAATLLKLLSPFWTPRKIYLQLGLNLLAVPLLIVLSNTQAEIIFTWSNQEITKNLFEVSQRQWHILLIVIGVILLIDSLALLNKLRRLK